MTNSKITDLPSATTLDDADIITTVQSGTNKQSTLGAVRTSADLRTGPPVGWGLFDPSILSMGNTIFTSSVLNRVMFSRFPLQAGTYDSLSYNLSSASSGGTALGITLGLYPDDGTGWWPSCGSGPIWSASISTPTTTPAIKTGTFTSAQVITRPTVLWGAFWFTYTGAPSTYPTLTTITNNLQSLPKPNSTTTPFNAYATVRCFALTGQSGGLPSTAITTSTMGVAGDSLAPALLMHRSA